jgi:predicted 2-oxoglutarate/Fe(II)-dependent dioxygenase YbiX
MEKLGIHPAILFRSFNAHPHVSPILLRRYTAVIDAWSKSFLRGAADRANLLLDKMETKYQAGDTDLKPNT